MRPVRFLFIALMCFAASSMTGVASEYVLSPVDDTFIVQSEPGSNFGAAPDLAIGFVWPATNAWITYLKFDLAAIPANETIVSAFLYLYQWNGAGYAFIGTNLRHLEDDDWTEDEVTWIAPPLGLTPYGYPLLGDLLAYNPNGYAHRGWSSWDLFQKEAWDPLADQADGLLTLQVFETMGGTQTHNYFSKEAAENRPYLVVKSSPVIISPRRYDFGRIRIGCSALKTFTLENRGGSTIEIDSVSIAGASPTQFEVQNDSCSGSVLPDSGQCDVDIVFGPDALGSAEALVQVAFVDDRIDILEAALTGSSTVACEGDFDADGDVDGTDLSIFAADFGRTDCNVSNLCEGDFNGDGDVDGSDLAIFAADFGRTDCPFCY